MLTWCLLDEYQLSCRDGDDGSGKCTGNCQNTGMSVND